jgi:hypothetical protein
MPNLKGYRIPADLPLILETLWLLIYYNFAIAARPMPLILESIRSLKKNNNSRSPESDATLDKAWRACNFFLLRIACSGRPCLKRALVMYNFSSRMGLEAAVKIGVLKGGSGLAGHGWIEIKGAPYREEMEELAKYTVMLTG